VKTLNNRPLLLALSATDQMLFGNFLRIIAAAKSRLLEGFECFVLIADQHAVMSGVDEESARRNAVKIVKDCMELGFSGENVHFCTQSGNEFLQDSFKHLRRLTEAVGLSNYELLMSADMLGFSPDCVVFSASVNKMAEKALEFISNTVKAGDEKYLAPKLVPVANIFSNNFGMGEGISPVLEQGMEYARAFKFTDDMRVHIGRIITQLPVTAPVPGYLPLFRTFMSREAVNEDSAAKTLEKGLREARVRVREFLHRLTGVGSKALSPTGFGQTSTTCAGVGWSR